MKGDKIAMRHTKTLKYGEAKLGGEHFKTQLSSVWFHSCD